MNRFIGYFRDKNRPLLTKAIALFELSVVILFIILLMIGFFWS
jgi:hypothetical protein